MVEHKSNFRFIFLIFCFAYISGVGYIAQKVNPNWHKFYKSEDAAQGIESITISSRVIHSVAKKESLAEVKSEPRYSLKNVVESELDMDEGAQLIDMDPKGYTHLYKDNLIVRKNLNNEVVWRFKLANQKITISQALVFKNTLILLTNQNSLLSLDMEAGILLWQSVVKAKKANSLLKTSLGLYVSVYTSQANEDKKIDQLIQLSNETGDILWVSPIIGYLEKGSLAFEQDGQLIGMNQKGLLFAIDKEKSAFSWNMKVPGEKSSPPLVTKDAVLVSTSESKLIKVSRKTGEILWEAEVRHPALAKPTLLPKHNIVICASENGYIQVFDLDKGESLWRLNTFNKNQTFRPIAIQMNNEVIQEKNLKWKYGGWIIAAPCSVGRICLINPEQGQTLGRLSFKNTPLIKAPMLTKEAIWGLVESESGPKLLKVTKSVPTT